MLESEIVFEGVVDYFDELAIEARIRAGEHIEFELEVYPPVFPIPLDKLQGGEIFYVLASGNFVIPPPWTEEELGARAKAASDKLARFIFEDRVEEWNSQSETSPTNATAPNDGLSSQDSD